MKITKEEVGFQTEVNVGKFAYILHLPENDITNSVHIDINDLFKKAIHFPRIILKGEPLLQKEEVAKFVKKIKNKNSDIKFEIETSGSIRPVGLNTTEVDYHVTIPLNSDTLSLKERVNVNVISWFVEADANFKFYIETEKDIDTIEMIIKMASIPKRLVHIISLAFTNKKDIMILAKHYGYNWSPHSEEYDKNE